jgi:RNA polymerase sigma factor (sigma-70 family)
MDTTSSHPLYRDDVRPSLAPRPSNAVDVSSPESCERLFVSCLPVIRRAVAVIARRHQLPVHEAEELGAIVQLRIIKDDYAVLRKFQGRSSLRTFLFVVIERAFLDHRTSQWGRWRPSARSRQIGKVAVLLEQLTVRDGLTFEQACRVLEINHRLTVDSDVLAGWATEFPRRTRPRFVGDDVLAGLETSRDAPDDQLVDAARAGVVARAALELGAALEQFTPQDRQILKLRFADGLSTAEIARMLHLASSPLYVRINRLLRTLRMSLEARGLQRDDVLAALGAGTGDRIEVFAETPDACAEAAPTAPCIPKVA